MQRLHKSRTQISETRTHKQRIFEFFHEKREWVKLNTSYVAGTATGATCSFVSSYVAEKSGMDRAHATTWIAGLSAYIGGVTAVCVTWWFLHKDKYREDTTRLLRDMLKLIGNTFLAQACTWGASWSATLLAISAGASNFVGVAVQQTVDWLIFIPLFNFLNRGRVKEMEQDDDVLTDK